MNQSTHKARALNEQHYFSDQGVFILLFFSQIFAEKQPSNKLRKT